MINNNRFFSAIVFLIGALLFISFYNYLDSKDKGPLTIISLFGTLFSLLGIFLTFLQIRSIKQTAVETKIAIDNYSSRFNFIITITEITKGSKVINEIETYLFDRKHELALLRMKELKDLLIKLRANQDFSKEINQKRFRDSIRYLSVDINNIKNGLLDSKDRVDYILISQHLEGLATLLVEHENKLKNTRK